MDRVATGIKGLDGILNGGLRKARTILAVGSLGPYSQEGAWSISKAHNSGEASGIFEVDLND